MGIMLCIFLTLSNSLSLPKISFGAYSLVGFFWGFYNSCLMTAFLPLRKIIKIQELGQLLLKERVSLPDLS